LLSLFLFLGV
jgi:hypothetical protein